MMRSNTKAFAKGDAIDKQITRILKGFYSQPKAKRSSVVVKRNKANEKEALEIEMATYLPFVKLSPEKYLIGTHQRFLQLKENGCLVRTGGGYMELNDYMKNYARSECI